MAEALQPRGMFAGHSEADDFFFECIAVSFCRFSNLGSDSIPTKKFAHGFLRIMFIVGSAERLREVRLRGISAVLL